MKLSSAGFDPHAYEGEKRVLNSELWHACAGPLVSLPSIGSRVVYFPQGHSEQVAVSTNKEVDAHMPNYPSLPPQLICQLHNVTMHADVETDEVYAQMTLQPLTQEEQKEPYLPAELGIPSRQPTNYFCKTLTASDTSTHGGFSVPRRAAEKVFPPLDYSLQPPAQELIARDIHDNEWKFRHVFRGQPKRHLLTTGWSVFVSAKRLVAGDAVLFIWNEKNQLFLGIKRANRPQTVMPSSVLSSDSMHLGLLAAAAHAAATNSRFTIFYNPRASPSEFVIPLVKYVKAVCHTRVSVGMRFRMLFETEESSVRRYMGTITGISDMDPTRWPNSRWRSVKVGWDESTAGDKQPRVSFWDIEPLTSFPMYPSPFHLRLKRPYPSGLPSLPILKGAHMGSINPALFQSLNFQSIGGIAPWIQPRFDGSMPGLQTDMYQTMAALQDIRSLEPLNPYMTQQFYSRPVFYQGDQQNQESLSRAQTQAYLQQELQHQNQLNNQLQHSQPVINRQPAPTSIPSTSQSASVSVSQNRQQNISDTTTPISPFQSLMSPVLDGDTSQLFDIPKISTQLMNSSGWPSKRPAVDLVQSEAPRSIVPPPVEPSGQPQSNVSQNLNSGFFSPFSGRDCSMNQDGNTNPQIDLFGLGIEPNSFLMHNGIGSVSTTLPFTSSTYMNTIEFPATANPAMAPSSFVDETGFQSQENVGQSNPQTATFVKVYKSGSFGRSLDISKFNSYQELRGELGRMFGLEGQLEDPLRSGWQLVFVDRENDVLLLGDDPWPEFVSSVWCIKILSPQEVQEMGKRGLELLNSAPNGGSDDYGSGHNDSRNLSSGVTSVGSLEY